MLPVIATLAASGALGAYMTQKATKDMNEANKQNAREQMNFQERMSSTAHQREQADLIAAGLNPLLAAGGSGASAPSGAMANVAAAKDPIGAALHDSVNSAVSGMSLTKELQQKDASIALTQEQTKATEKAADLSASSALKNYNDLTMPERSGSNAGLRDKNYQSKLTKEIANDQLEKMQIQTDKDMHKFDSTNRRIQSGLSTVQSAVDTINPLKALRKTGPTQTTTERYNRQGEHTGSTVRRTSN